MKKKTILTLGLLALLTQYAAAEYIVAPINAVATSAQRVAVDAINGDGLSDTALVETGVTDVRFTVVSTFNEASIAGISEIRFVAVSVI